jgi:hypothetical protein
MYCSSGWNETTEEENKGQATNITKMQYTNSEHFKTIVPVPV